MRDEYGHWSDSDRLSWLIRELNMLHSNVTRDVFGLAGDEEGDISREWLDEQINNEDGSI